MCDYVHLNPARAGLVRPEQALSAYGWSSWPEYLKSPSRRWLWLRVDRLLAQMAGGMGEHHGGEERHASAEAVAEGIVDEELKRLGWREADLARRPKGDAGKVAMARRLRRETTMTLRWIARRLGMGNASMVTHCLRNGP